MLRLAADRAGGLLNERNPCMLWQAVGDHAVNHEIDAHCHDANDMAQIDAAPPRNILDVFNEPGVAVMTPYCVADPSAARLVVPHERYTTLASAPEA